VEILKKQVIPSLAFIFISAFCESIAAANTTACVSVATNGTESNGYSYEPSISSDGRYMAFTSYTTNLFANATNGGGDIFVRGSELSSSTLVNPQNVLFSVNPINRSNKSLRTCLL